MSLMNKDELTYDLAVFNAVSINEDFERATVGDFDLLMLKKYGYCNLSRVCDTAGKTFSNWSKLEGSKEYIKYIEANESGVMTDPAGKRVALYQVIK